MFDARDDVVDFCVAEVVAVAFEGGSLEVVAF